MASVVDIKAVSYDVCGIVEMVGSGFRAKVISNFFFNIHELSFNLLG